MKRHGLHFSTRPRLFPARLLEARFVESKQQNLDGRFFPSQNFMWKVCVLFWIESFEYSVSLNFFSQKKNLGNCLGEIFYFRKFCEKEIQEEIIIV